MPTLSALNDEYLIVIKLSRKEAAKTLSASSSQYSALIIIKMPLRRT